MNVLVIVDMQASFPNAFIDHVIRGVQKEIINAKSKGDYIVVLEYNDFTVKGPTLREITGCIGDYPHFSVVSKDDNDGSKEVLKELGEKGIWAVDEFRLVGVNLEWCVSATACGLRSLYSDFVIEFRGATSMTSSFKFSHDPQINIIGSGCDHPDRITRAKLEENKRRYEIGYIPDATCMCEFNPAYISSVGYCFSPESF